ncbi:hypothetical protein Tco_1141050, partial [Tanacetum coccineum]
FELTVVGEGCADQTVIIVEGSMNRQFITKALEEEATVMKPVSKKKKTDDPRRMSARDNVPPLPTAAAKGIGKHTRLLARYIGNLARSSDSLAPNVEEAHATHNMLSDGGGGEHAELNGLPPRLKEAEVLVQRSQALGEVHGLGDSWDFKDVADYHPKAKKIYDKAAEAFYKCKIPYISLIGEKAGQSLEELAVVEAPSVQEALSS